MKTPSATERLRQACVTFNAAIAKGAGSLRNAQAQIVIMDEAVQELEQSASGQQAEPKQQFNDLTEKGQPDE